MRATSVNITSSGKGSFSIDVQSGSDWNFDKECGSSCGTSTFAEAGGKDISTASIGSGAGGGGGTGGPTASGSFPTGGGGGAGAEVVRSAVPDQVVGVALAVAALAVAVGPRRRRSYHQQ